MPLLHRRVQTSRQDSGVGASLRNIYSTAYIYSHVALDLSRLRGIEWFEEYGGGCHVQPLCSFTVSRGGGGRWSDAAAAENADAFA